MKLHELEVGKLYFKVNGEPEVIYKIDRDKDGELYLWYRHKASPRMYLEEITIALIKEDFEECSTLL